MKSTLISILLLIGYHTISLGQSLDSIAPQVRESILISITKVVVLKYGPAYFRDYKKPTISRAIYPSKNMIDTANANRPYYEIAFIYDPKIEKDMLPWDYSYKVYVWADNWHPSKSMFGNGLGRIISNSDGERIANLVRKKMGYPTTKPDNYEYKVEKVEPMPYRPIKEKEEAASMRTYLIEKQKEEGKF